MPDKAISPELLSALTSADQLESKTHVLRLKPRISATKLAEYVVTNPSRQERIAHDAKNAKKAMMYDYNRVRHSVKDALTDHGLNPAVFVQRAVEIEAIPVAPGDVWNKRNNALSADALKHLAIIAPKIDCEDVQLIRCPAKRWGSLEIQGVRVSVQPELVFSFIHRDAVRVGGVILNTGKSESLSLERKSSANHSVGDYLAALLHMMLSTRLHHVGTPLNSRCHAVDVFREEVYPAPGAFKTLTKHLEAACKMIALRWPTIPLTTESESEETEDAIPF